jgi:hypothetical protein
MPTQSPPPGPPAVLNAPAPTTSQGVLEVAPPPPSSRCKFPLLSSQLPRTSSQLLHPCLGNDISSPSQMPPISQLSKPAKSPNLRWMPVAAVTPGMEGQMEATVPVLSPCSAESPLWLSLPSAIPPHHLTTPREQNSPPPPSSTVPPSLIVTEFPECSAADLKSPNQTSPSFGPTHLPHFSEISPFIPSTA